MFMVRDFLPNAIDVVRTGTVGLKIDLLAAEFRSNHRISARRFIADLLPKGAVGAELGVFTGFFSASLLRYARPKKMFFVDPWWKMYGDSQERHIPQRIEQDPHCRSSVRR